MAIFYAFCCLGFSAGNDFIFKLFARKNRSRGLFMAVIGLVSAVLFMLIPEDPLTPAKVRATLIWGVIGGFFSVSANILLIESMSRMGAGVCSTIYRLNMAIVVPMAVLLFGESLNWMQWIGVGFALAAVLCFLPSGKEASGSKKSASKVAFAMIITAAVLRAGMGLAYKYGFSIGASPLKVNAITGVSWLVFGIAYLYFREYRGGAVVKDFISAKVAGYGVLSGGLVMGITYTMAFGLKAGDASIVLSIAQMGFLLTFFLSVLILHEKVTPFKVTAMLCGVVALSLLSYKPADKKVETEVETPAEVQKNTVALSGK